MSARVQSLTLFCLLQCTVSLYYARYCAESDIDVYEVSILTLIQLKGYSGSDWTLVGDKYSRLAPAGFLLLRAVLQPCCTLGRGVYS